MQPEDESVTLETTNVALVEAAGAGWTAKVKFNGLIAAIGRYPSKERAAKEAEAALCRLEAWERRRFGVTSQQ